MYFKGYSPVTQQATTQLEILKSSAPTSSPLHAGAVVADGLRSRSGQADGRRTSCVQAHGALDVYRRGMRRHDQKDRTGVGSTGSLDFDQLQLGVSDIYCHATKPSSTAIRSLIFTAAVAM